MTRIVDAGADREAWRTVLSSLPDALRDVYFTPEYAALHASRPGSRAVCFVHEHGGHLYLQPSIVLPLPEDLRGTLGKDACDLETPYGYGGPLCDTEDAAFLAEAHGAYADWCRQQGVVAEFVRFHPLLGTHRWASPDTRVSVDRQTFSIDLSCLGDGGLAAYRPETRNAIRRAEALGVSVSDDLSHFGTFVDLYLRTMRRLGAEATYDFSPAHFEGLHALVATSGLLLSAVRDGHVVASSLFLKGSHSVHYHLSCSDPDRRVQGSSNLLIHAAGLRGRASGAHRLHLGGGTTGEVSDSLRRFKERMATDAHVFRIGRRIHDPVSYERLCDRWRARHPDLVPRYGGRLLCYRHGNPPSRDDRD